MESTFRKMTVSKHSSNTIKSKIGGLLTLLSLFTGGNVYGQNCIEDKLTDISWDKQFNVGGANNIVNAIAVDGDEIYLGGIFTNLAGNLKNDRIAKWNGNCWEPLGEGLNSVVSDILIDGSYVYVAGAFEDAGGNPDADYLAVWDGESWGAVVTGLNDIVNSLHAYNGELILGGDFTGLGGEIDYLASFDGTNLQSIGGVVDGPVYDIEIMGDDLYIAGNFDLVGEVEGTRSVAKWNGSNWEPLDNGLGGLVYELEASGSDLYLGGHFHYNHPLGDGISRNVIKWNSNSWEKMGETPFEFVSNHPDNLTIVTSIKVIGDNLFVGGFFDSDYVYQSSNRYLMSFDGENWNPVMGESVTERIKGPVYSLGSHNESLIIGGDFGDAGDQFDADKVALFDTNSETWSSVVQGNGLTSSSTSLAIFNDELYVGGHFYLGANGPDRFTKWTDNGWAHIDPDMGYGFNFPYISTMKSAEDGIYVGGFFSDVADENGDRIVKWNGAGWESIGSGINSTPSDIEVFNNTLYVASSSTLDIWDGNSWSAINVFGYEIQEMVTIPTGLFVIGSFVNWNGNPDIDGIAKWNGIDWEPFREAPGAGLNGATHAAVLYNDLLVVGGEFTEADGNAVNHIAAWNGSNWEALGTGLNSTVRSMKVADGKLFVGGDFTVADGTVPAGKVAIWDGSNWSGLSSGLNGTVLDLEVVDNTLYLAGTFSITDYETISSGFGAYSLAPTIQVPQTLPELEGQYGASGTTSYSVVVNNLSEDLTIMASANFELSVDEGASFHPSVELGIPSSTELFADLQVRVTSTSDAGNYNGTINHQSSELGEHATSISGEISKAELIASAMDKTGTYGEPIPTLEVEYQGFVNGETEGVIDTPPTPETSATQESNAGTYPITLSGGTDNNYELSLSAGELIIQKANQTITFEDVPTGLSEDADDFELIASSSSGLQVDFESNDQSILTISGSVASILDGGKVIITASQSGNTNYNAAENVQKMLSIEKILGLLDEYSGFRTTPNPAKESFRILTDDGKQANGVFLLDIQGRLVKHFYFKENAAYDISEIPNGAYLLLLEYPDGNTEISKVIKTN